MSTAQMMTLEVEDVTGQVRRRAHGIAPDTTVAEMTEHLAWRLELPEQDASGRPVLYSARTADGEALNPTDFVGDVLKEQDRVILSPSVTAG